MTDFITKDSGERAQFDSGMQRDTEAGKPRFDLMIPLDVPYEEQFFTRVAALLGRGAIKYDERNWEQANSEAELARMKSSAYRHFIQWITGETDEDHAAAVVFNLLAHETTAYKMAVRASLERLNPDWADELDGVEPNVGCPEEHLHTVDCPGVTVDQIRDTMGKVYADNRESFRTRGRARWVEVVEEPETVAEEEPELDPMAWVRDYDAEQAPQTPDLLRLQGYVNHTLSNLFWPQPETPRLVQAPLRAADVLTHIPEPEIRIGRVFVVDTDLGTYEEEDEATKAAQRFINELYNSLVEDLWISNPKI